MSLLLVALVSACATTSLPVSPAAPAGGAPSGFVFASDTFAFPNLIRAHVPNPAPDLYANYCFVLGRGLRQFFGFARFEPAAPRLTEEEYTERVRRIAALPPWRQPRDPDDRIVIPGYANLREFSEAQESAVKAGLGPRTWTLWHWTNWRVTFPVTRAHQAGVAEAVAADLDAGRLVQLLVTNWPKPELNHTVVAYAYVRRDADVELTVWDPNEVERPGTVTFEGRHERFWATRVYATRPGVIRVFRMYHSPWL